LRGLPSVIIVVWSAVRPGSPDALRGDGMADVVLVGFVAGLTFGGWRTGLVHRLAGLAFMAIALVVGAYLRGPFGDLASSFFKDIPPDYASLVGYAFAFPVVLGVLHLVSYRVLRGRRLGGMTNELDKGLGALFGFIEGVLILSAVVVILDTYFATGPTVGHRPGIDLGTVQRFGDGPPAACHDGAARASAPGATAADGHLIACSERRAGHARAAFPNSLRLRGRFQRARDAYLPMWTQDRAS
jgi:uncharacterized membrane protein required for colicin V production